MSVKVYPLSTISGYSVYPIKKIYSTKWIGMSDLKKVYNNIRNIFVLGKHGEIKLTKACDASLQDQTKKANGNAVLGAHYSIAFPTSVGGDQFEAYSSSVAVMYAYGEAVKLVKDA